MLTDAERQTLLRFARETIAAHLTQLPLPALTAVGALNRRSGAFVTLRAEEKLRGCIGYVEADNYLIEVVQRCAISAAINDPRFPPVRLEELPVIKLEISVLGGVEPVVDTATIELGRHGLVVQRGYRRGLLLPQVATEWAWDRDTFLAQTCVKAGLPANAWRNGAQIFRFEAEIFAELDIAPV